jgi:iron complex outermembrane receptor protein
VSLDGKQVISTPRYISNLGVEYQPNASWRFGLQGRAQDDYYIDNLNAQGKHGGFALLDTSLRYAINATTSIDFQIRNLTDREYEYVWYDNFFWGGADQPMYSPAPGRTAYVSLDIKL